MYTAGLGMIHSKMYYCYSLSPISHLEYCKCKDPVYWSLGYGPSPAHGDGCSDSGTAHRQWKEEALFIIASLAFGRCLRIFLLSKECELFNQEKHI